MTLQTSPFRRGICPIFGLFMGGSDINYKYALKIKYSYKLTTQLQTPKKYITSKIALIDVRSDLPKLKFHGKLDTPSYFVTGYEKENFL